MFSRLFSSYNPEAAQNFPEEGGFSEVPEPSGYSPLPKMRSPGSFDNVAVDFRDNFGFLETFGWKGLQVSVANYIAPNFLSSFQFNMGKKETKNPMTGQLEGDRSSTTFAVVHQGKNLLMRGSCDTKGTLQAMTSFTGRFQAGLSAQIPASDPGNISFNLGYNFPTTSVEFRQHGPSMLLSALQAVTPKTIAGVCLTVVPGEGGQNSTGWKALIASGTKSEGRIAAMVDTGLPGFIPTKKAQLHYTRNIMPAIEMIAGLDATYDPKSSDYDSTASLGYQYRDDTMNVRSFVDTKLKVGAMASLPLLPVAAVDICGDIDVNKNTYDIGVGLSFHI
eukprot:TRINITY_DN369_c0_g1_i2.p1 TRINITY_DN369_c0_g1~~TRINITY_DN369_c0_g1_i2.p1  ORF type:complete len:346 (-),score=97.38 TRINITY_DN369_c0_g1_i2:311-1312(-)